MERLGVSEPLDELSILEFALLYTTIGKGILGFTFSLVIDPRSIVDITTLVIVNAMAVAHSILVLANIVFAIWKGVLPISMLLVIYPISNIRCT